MIIIHDHRIPGKYLDILKCKISGAVWCPFECPASRTYESIKSHPDIHFFKLDKNSVVYSPSVGDETLRLLARAGINLFPGLETPGAEYPASSKYNAVRVGRKVFHNFKHTDKSVLEQIDALKLEKIGVKQGYTKCAVLLVGDSAMITSDTGISKAGIASGIDVLKVGPGGVTLEGEKCGFIGGASGNLPSGATIVLGDLKYHTDCLKITSFFSRQKIDLICCDGLPIYDAGSLLVLDN
ncbi:MAG: hypothetical protein HQL28_00790 [Candidatus Omnitrophica bacterium]|nr:hypothetical protein [Candidatus Omnitrophota bacterium]